LRRKAVIQCATRVRYNPKFRGGSWWNIVKSGPTKIKGKPFKTTIVSEYTEVEFHHKCEIWIEDIKSCHSEKEWKRLSSLYTNFIRAYSKNHPKIKYPRAPSWKWVKSHYHHHKSESLTVKEAKFINNLMNNCLPQGIDKTHSKVYENEHLEYIVGSTIQETIHNYEKEAQWWLARINSCTSQEQYIHYVQQYHYLAQVYEEHNVHVHEQACPSWEYVSTHSH
jgi:hypothetical protein